MSATTPGAFELCGRFGGCVLPAGHNRGMADIPENHRRPDPAPAAPAPVRRPWSTACARRHDHPACTGALPPVEDPWGADTAPLPCGCPCHQGGDLTSAVDALTASTLDRAERVHAARLVVRLAAHLDPASLADHRGEGPEAREVRRMGRALLPAARLHADTTAGEGEGRG